MKIPVALSVSVLTAVASSLLLTGVLSLDTSIIPTKAPEDFHIQEAGAQELPLEVRNRFKENKLAGDANNIIINEDFVDPESHCEFCTLIEYRPGPRGVAGFAYENDAGLDLTGANKVRFWIMGEQGNERVKFKIAGKNIDNTQDRRPNTSTTNTIFESERFVLTTEEIALSNDWRRYEIDLTGISLDDITYPFGLEISQGNGVQEQMVYIKGLVFDEEPVEERYALPAIEDYQITTQQQPPLSVEIISNSTEGVAPATFEFQANLTGGLEPYSINWNFDDNENPIEVGNDETVVHTFEEAGMYNVTLTATDIADQTTVSDSLEIEVLEGAEIDEEENEDDNDNNIQSQESEEGQQEGEEEEAQSLEERSDA